MGSAGEGKVPGIILRASCMLDRPSATDLYTQPELDFVLCLLSLRRDNDFRVCQGKKLKQHEQFIIKYGEKAAVQ